MKKGFAIGFALVAILGGLWAWREGLLRPSGERRVEVPAELMERPRPPAAPQTPPAAPNGTAPQAAPGAAPTSPPPAARTEPGTPSGESRSAAAEPRAEATPAPGGVAAGQGGAKPDDKGAFDVVRVEPSGESVVAGRCAAGCTAELTSNGRTIDKATADASGSFAMTPPTLPPGDHQLGLTVTTPEGKKETSEQTVTVSVPKAPSKDVVVVLNEPDAPSKILQKPGQEPAAAKADGEERAAALQTKPNGPPVAAVVALSLGAIDAENGRFFVQGTAPAGSKLRIYLNNAPIAEATAGADGRWSLRVERGLAPGRYTARVDHLGPDGKVVKRAEASFDYEPEVAAATPAQPQPEPQASGREPSSRSETGSGQNAGPQGRTEAPAGQSAAATPDRQPSAPSTSPSATRGATEGGAASSEPPAGSPDMAAPETEQPSAAQARSAEGRSQPPAPEEGTPSAGGADPANPVVASIDTATVRRGDSLWRISRTTYGHGRRYTVIFSANDDQIRNPNLIYPGQVLVLPTEGSDAAESRPR